MIGHIETLIDTGSTLEFVEDWIENLKHFSALEKNELKVWAWAWLESLAGKRRHIVTAVPSQYIG